MDVQMMERLARVVAKEVVDDMKGEIRDEIRKEFRAYFGDMTPTQHAIEHDHLKRMLDRLDRVSGGFMGGLASKAGVLIAGLIVLGMFAWFKKGGAI